MSEEKKILQSRWLFLFFGIIIGIVFSLITSAIVVRQTAAGMMITEGESKYGFAETIDKVNESVYENDWKLVAILNMTSLLRASSESRN